MSAGATGRVQPRPGHPRAGGWGGIWAVLLLWLTPSLLAGQEGQVEEPAMAEAPRSFRIAATGGGFLWDDAETRVADDLGLAGLSVERDLASFVAVRLEGAFGSSTFLGPGAQTEDINTWVLDLVVTGRVPGLVDPVTPFVSGGLGTTIFDPEDPELVTRNQNSLQFGGGVDVQPFPRFGFRAEYRRYSVDVENLFDVLDRTGESREANRFTAAVFWTF